MKSSTTVAKFREKLSTWLDSASSQPVFINRGDERFALMNEVAYRELQQKINDLQTSLIAVLETGQNSTSSELEELSTDLKEFKRKEA